MRVSWWSVVLVHVSGIYVLFIWCYFRVYVPHSHDAGILFVAGESWYVAVLYTYLCVCVVVLQDIKCLVLVFQEICR